MNHFNAFRPASTALAIVFAFSNVSAAQERLVTIGAGMSGDTAGTAYTFALSFNRTEAAEAEPGVALWTRVRGNRFFSIIPSAEANIGSGVDVASNNVLIDMALEYVVPGKRTQWKTSLAPTVTADKNFKTGLYYLRAGIQHAWYTHPVYPRVFATIGLYGDAGRRTTEKQASNNFLRVVPKASFSVGLRSGLTASSNLKVWTTSGDERVTPNGTKAYVKSDVTYRPTIKGAKSSDAPYAELKGGPLGLTIAHTFGYDEPLFVRQHSATVGVSLYR